MTESDKTPPRRTHPVSRGDAQAILNFSREPSSFNFPPSDLLSHARIVLPRRPDATAIVGKTVGQMKEEMNRLGRLHERPRSDARTNDSIPDAIKHWSDQLIKHHLNATKHRDGSAIDLVDFWTELLALLRELEGGKDLRWFFHELVNQLNLNPLSGDFEDLLENGIIKKQYVGHCGIIDRITPTSAPWVIESSHDHGGIRTLPYSSWLTERAEGGAQVWVYEIKTDGLDPARLQNWKQHFVDTAHRYRMQGVPYGIFDGQAGTDGASDIFSIHPKPVAPLGDVRHLYCSELVWLCAKEALGIDLRPYEPDHTSAFQMFTPKDLTRSPYLIPVNLPMGNMYLR